MKISFLHNEMENPKFERTDGLMTALKILESRGHTVGYFSPDNASGIEAFKADVLLHHASFLDERCDYVMDYPGKKAMCFAGGPVENPRDYDLYFLESEVNEAEFTALGKTWKRAFGINETLFTPQSLPKKYDGAFCGSFAKWKRPELFASLGSKGIALGEFQESEKECYEVCQKAGVLTENTVSRERVAEAINESHTVVNLPSYWGGGQRLTLEAMACNVPPIVASDSPKNVEYVEESGFGLVINPDVHSLRAAIEYMKDFPMKGGRDYILSFYTATHYANQLEEGLLSL